MDDCDAECFRRCKCMGDVCCAVRFGYYSTVPATPSTTEPVLDVCRGCSVDVTTYLRLTEISQMFSLSIWS
jgi:hypothetical protein